MSKRSYETAIPVPSVVKEFENADLGDKRLNERLLKMAREFSKAPDKSFPALMSSRSELEASYRFLGNERVSYGSILAPHIEATLGRAERETTCLVLHDTSEQIFSGEDLREGLTLLRSGQQGFLLHAAIAVSADGLRRPLGTLGAEPLLRKLGAAKSDPEYETKKESRRWLRLVEKVAERANRRVNLIHVMDREADAYELLAAMVTGNHRFVVRMHHDRAVLGENGASDSRLWSVLTNAEFYVEREVEVSKRSKRNRPPDAIKKAPIRDKRNARVSIKAMSMVIKKSSHVRGKGIAPSIKVNVVHVIETAPPEGEKPVEWLIATTEPISTAEEVERVVDHYRARWTIEEFFKALKTGCSFEKRQLATCSSLRRALMFSLPFAWRLLLLRSLARTSPETPASAALTEAELTVLQTQTKLPREPSARDALLAIARLGGHLKNNGEPGWIVIGRGMEKLALIMLGWLAAQPSL